MKEKLQCLKHLNSLYSLNIGINKSQNKISFICLLFELCFSKSSDINTFDEDICVIDGMTIKQYKLKHKELQKRRFVISNLNNNNNKIKNILNESYTDDVTYDNNDNNNRLSSPFHQ